MVCHYYYYYFSRARFPRGLETKGGGGGAMSKQKFGVGRFFFVDRFNRGRGHSIGEKRRRPRLPIVDDATRGGGGGDAGVGPRSRYTDHGRGPRGLDPRAL